MHIAKLLAAAGALALGACATPDASLTARQHDSTGLLLGRVSFPSQLAAPIVVVALDRKSGKIVHRAFLETDRTFRMPMAAGYYKFFAFADENRDGALGAGEPSSYLYSLSNEIRARQELELPTLHVQARASVAARR